MRRYHHGDLKESLVAVALKHVDLGSLDKATLRGLAEELGVSSSAPYRHFKSQAALHDELEQRIIKDFLKDISYIRLRNDKDSHAKLEALNSYITMLIKKHPLRARYIGLSSSAQFLILQDQIVYFYTYLGFGPVDGVNSFNKIALALARGSTEILKN